MSKILFEDLIKHEIYNHLILILFLIAPVKRNHDNQITNNIT